MKKIFLILLLISLSCATCIFITYAEENKPSFSDLTIKELNKNIEKLKNEKIEFQEKNKKLWKEYWELIYFIKTDLTDDEIDEIKEKVNIFIEERNLLQKKLKEKISKLEDATKEKKDIIIHMANFYKYIAKFVQKEKKEDFIAHVKFHIQSEKEFKDLVEEILKNKNILEKKVNYIKRKIEDHKEDLQSHLENLLISKIKKRIDEIDNDPKYKWIDKKIKNKIYADFINQVKDRLNDIDSSNLSENYKYIRRNILNKMIDEIQAKITD